MIYHKLLKIISFQLLTILKRNQMKLSNEFFNGCIIFIGIAAYFLLMNALGYADLFYLRLLNIFIVFYGVNRVLKTNLANGKNQFAFNAFSALLTSLIGVSLSILGLVGYSYIRGGEAFIQTLSKTFLFGGNPSIDTYSICLFFEGVASSVIVTFLLMLYYNNHYTTDT